MSDDEVIAPAVDPAALDALERAVDDGKTATEALTAGERAYVEEAAGLAPPPVPDLARRLEILERLVVHGTAILVALAAAQRLTGQEIGDARAGIVRELTALGLLAAKDGGE